MRVRPSRRSVAVLNSEADMEAIVRDKYGSPDVLRLEEVPAPLPREEEILVKIHAAAVNKGDWEILNGSPLWVRLVGFGLFRPRVRILGSNFAGRVVAVGSAVTRFEVGDDVCGDLLEHGLGAFAEFVCAPQDAAVVRKPAGLSYAQAASLPESGLIALQALRDKGNISPGQQVLINGAGGGAGAIAIQLAKSMGAEVTAVDAGGKLGFMSSLGADHVVDYTTGDLASRNATYDFILDVGGAGSIRTWRRLLRPGGRYMAAGGTVGQLLKTLLAGAWVSWRSRQTIGVLALDFNARDISTVLDLVDSGTIQTTIDRRFPLPEVANALRYLGAGKSTGKLVITVADDEQG